MSTLTLISLPIGNLKDLTYRAREVLESENIFYAEDTRVFKKLLDSIGISYLGKEIDSFHDHSLNKIDYIEKRIKSGESVCLVSDAGSPLISDPAYPLIKKLVEAGIKIKTIPGVTSLITALELSGLPPHPLHFWGFIGRGNSEKINFFSELSTQSGTHVFFESPHRIADTVKVFFNVNPTSEIVIARELTKTYESIYRINENNKDHLEEFLVEKGEFVVLFNVSFQNKKKPKEKNDLKILAEDFLKGKAGTKKLAKILSKILEMDQKAVYDQLIKSGKNED